MNRIPAAVGHTTPTRRRSSLLALALVATLGALLLFAGVAVADVFTPDSESGSKNAREIDSLYKLVLAVAVVVFVGVEGCLIYSLVKFRARKGAVPAQIHGNTRLEIGWTVGAAVILVVLSIITFAKLDDIRNPPNSGPGGLQLADGTLVASGPSERLPPNGKSLSICVNGQQYMWRFTYAPDCRNVPLNAPFSYEAMWAPVNTTVTMSITAQDVAHSWWIPALGGKMDAVPGYTNYLWFKATKTGLYRGQCAELCGRNHANMTARVHVVSVAAFERWIDRQRAAIRAANQAAAEQRRRVDRGQSP